MLSPEIHDDKQAPMPPCHSTCYRGWHIHRLHFIDHFPPEFQLDPLPAIMEKRSGGSVLHMHLENAERGREGLSITLAK